MSRADRDPYFDNAKLLAIVLVVVAHAWTPLRPGSHAVGAAYLLVFALHMPAFVVIAGYFTRSFRWEGGRLRRSAPRRCGGRSGTSSSRGSRCSSGGSRRSAPLVRRTRC